MKKLCLFWVNLVMIIKYAVWWRYLKVYYAQNFFEDSLGQNFNNRDDSSASDEESHNKTGLMNNTYIDQNLIQNYFGCCCNTENVCKNKKIVSDNNSELGRQYFGCEAYAALKFWPFLTQKERKTMEEDQVIIQSVFDDNSKDTGELEFIVDCLSPFHDKMIQSVKYQNRNIYLLKKYFDIS